MPHIPSERLADVVTDDDEIFTDQEFAHIRWCMDCLNKWKALLDEAKKPGTAIEP